MMMRVFILQIAILLGGTKAFAPYNPPIRAKNTELYAIEPAQKSPIDDLLDDVKIRIRIAQDSNASGSSFKQVVADFLAGEYDNEEANAKVDEAISSAPCGELEIWC